jgi:hypothetical protein
MTDDRHWAPDPMKPGYEYSLIPNGVIRRRISGGFTMGTSAAAPTPTVKNDEVEITRMFTSHIPNDWQTQAMNNARIEFANMARFILKTVPSGRERALTITHLEKAMFYANAGIVRPKPTSDYTTGDTIGTGIGVLPADRPVDRPAERGSGSADAR